MTDRQFGPFEIERQLGIGGMGVVYLATWSGDGQKRRVALKVLSPGLSADTKLLKRFDREIEILKRLTHPNIVKCFGGGVHQGQPYYAMEYINGGTIQDVLKKRKRLTVDQATRFLELNALDNDDVGYELVALGLRAATRGVERVHIVDGRSEGVVLQEIFSNLGVGTMVHANQYQSIRSMRRSDVPDVYRLMQPLVERGLLVQRTESNLHDTIDDYVVFETDGMVHGCGALHLFDEQHAEIAGLAVDDNYEHFGIGQRIVQFLIEGARRAGVGRVFVLTTQASDWFEQLGFRLGTVDDIPQAKRERYDYSRNSRVMLYSIDDL